MLVSTQEQPRCVPDVPRAAEADALFVFLVGLLAQSARKVKPRPRNGAIRTGMATIVRINNRGSWKAAVIQSRRALISMTLSFSSFISPAAPFTFWETRSSMSFSESWPAIAFFKTSCARRPSAGQMRHLPPEIVTDALLRDP